MIEKTYLCIVMNFEIFNIPAEYSMIRFFNMLIQRLINVVLCGDRVTGFIEAKPRIKMDRGLNKPSSSIEGNPAEGCEQAFAVRSYLPGCSG